MPLYLFRSLRSIRRLSSSSTSASVTALIPLSHPGNSDSNNKVRIKPELEEPALVKLKKERDPDRLFHLFSANAHNPLVVENKYAFEDTISRLAGAGRFDYIEALLEQQKSLPQGRREGFVVRVIMLYGKVGMIRQALDTFYDMHLFSCKRTVKSFNAAMKILANTGDMIAIGSFLKDIPCRFGIELDVISVNIVVSAFCRLGLLDKAYLAIVEMETMGINPDVVTYSTLILGLYKKGQCEIANGVWNLMVRKGCYPNVATFNARIQFLVCKNRAWDANDCMTLMERVGLQPDEVSYNLVIKGFCQAGYLDMAKRIYSALHGRGYKPNIKIYQTMVHYLCRAGEFDLAYTMCKDCMKKNWFLNVGTVCKLLDGLRKTGNFQKANMILALARKRNPPFCQKDMDALKSILART